ncbi:hypothetical protein, unlikely, partial [Trypanosoma congolense IL3000]
MHVTARLKALWRCFMHVPVQWGVAGGEIRPSARVASPHTQRSAHFHPHCVNTAPSAAVQHMALKHLPCHVMLSPPLLGVPLRTPLHYPHNSCTAALPVSQRVTTARCVRHQTPPHHEASHRHTMCHNSHTAQIAQTKTQRAETMRFPC